MEFLLAAWIMAQPAQSLSNDRAAILELYEDEDPSAWGLKDWDHEA